MDTAPGMREKTDVSKVRNPSLLLRIRIDENERQLLLLTFHSWLGFSFLRHAGCGGGREHDGVRRGVREGGAHRPGPHPPPRPGATAPVTGAVITHARGGGGSSLSWGWSSSDGRGPDSTTADESAHFFLFLMTESVIDDALRALTLYCCCRGDSIRAYHQVYFCIPN